MQPAKHHDHVMLADTPLENPLENLATEHIDDREQVIPPTLSVYQDILFIET